MDQLAYSKTFSDTLLSFPLEVHEIGSRLIIIRTSCGVFSCESGLLAELDGWGCGCGDNLATAKRTNCVLISGDVGENKGLALWQTSQGYEPKSSQAVPYTGMSDPVLSFMYATCVSPLLPSPHDRKKSSKRSCVITGLV